VSEPDAPALHSAAPESDYAGAQILLRLEADLNNYSTWIVDAFIHSLAGRMTSESRVLDFGCGIGTLSRIFRERTGIAPDGVEPDAKQRATFAARGFRGFASLAEAPASYDVIFTSNVLEHIEDDEAALRELAQHLADKGRLLVYVPAFTLLWTRMDDNIGHHRRYTRSELAAKLRRAGFSVSHSRYCDSVGFALALLFRLVGNKSGEPSSASLRLFDRCLLPISKMLDPLFSRFLGKNVFAVAHKISTRT
jgi:SAM-dependent methyltransferase